MPGFMVRSFGACPDGSSRASASIWQTVTTVCLGAEPVIWIDGAQTPAGFYRVSWFHEGGEFPVSPLAGRGAGSYFRRMQRNELLAGALAGWFCLMAPAFAQDTTASAEREESESNYK